MVTFPFVVIRPIDPRLVLLPRLVNHRAPSGPAAMYAGTLMAAAGREAAPSRWLVAAPAPWSGVPPPKRRAPAITANWARRPRSFVGPHPVRAMDTADIRLPEERQKRGSDTTR